MQRILFYSEENSDIHSNLRQVIINLNIEIVSVINIKEAARQLLNVEYNMVIVDSSVIEREGISLTDMLRNFTTVPILVVSMLTEGRENLHSASLKADSGSHFHHPHYQEHHPVRIGHYHILSFRNELIIDPNRRQILINGDDISATKKEFDLLYCLARHRGRVLTCEQLYNNLWLYDTSYNVDDLIKTHIKRLRKKMIASTHSYIENVRGVGYCFRE